MHGGGSGRATLQDNESIEYCVQDGALQVAFVCDTSIVTAGLDVQAMSLVFHSAHPFIPTLRADVRMFKVRPLSV